MKCKDVFGKKFCKFGSGMIEDLPIKTSDPVPLNIITSRSCRICNDEANKFIKRLNPIGNLVKKNVIDIDNNPEKAPLNVMSLPSITIGNHKVNIHTPDREIIQTIKKYLS